MDRSSSGTEISSDHDYNQDRNVNREPISAGRKPHVAIPLGAPDITPAAARALLRLFVAVHQKRCIESTDQPEAT
jgi:hypothetical protein